MLEGRRNCRRQWTHEFPVGPGAQMASVEYSELLVSMGQSSPPSQQAGQMELAVVPGEAFQTWVVPPQGGELAWTFG